MMMNNKIILKSLWVWAGIIPLAILNGILREVFLEPLFGTVPAQIISGLILIDMIFIMAYIFIPRLGEMDGPGYIKMGLVWGAATVIFETAFGLLMGMSAQEIFGAYDITTGNLWSLVVVFIVFAPWLVMRVRKSSIEN